jgi:hypothetical protein
LKDASVDVDGAKAPILRAMALAEPIMETWGEFVVTSVNDGKHRQGSLHYEGLAFDIRTWALKTAADKEHALRELKRALGPDYDVILEADHIHIEFDPKEA